MDDQRALLGRYLEALSDPTRANILFETESAGELTATQIGSRLGLTVNKVCHHIRVRNHLGVLAPPRVVPGSFDVEKYYRVRPALTEQMDPNWFDDALTRPSADQLQWAASCAHLGQVLLQAAQRYAAMTLQGWEETVLRESAGMLSRRDLARNCHLADLEKIRAVVSEPNPGGRDSGNIMIVAACLSYALWVRGGRARRLASIPPRRVRGRPEVGNRR